MVVLIPFNYKFDLLIMASLMENKIKYLNDIIEGKRPPPGIAKLLGFRIIDFCEGCTTIEIDIDERLYNPMNTVHGGILCDIADAAMGISFFTTLESDETFTSVDLRITFLKQVKDGTLRASSKIIRKGKRLGYMECEIFNQDDELVAKASSTCIILRNTKD